jgi:hypothetical protein
MAQHRPADDEDDVIVLRLRSWSKETCRPVAMVVGPLHRKPAIRGEVGLADQPINGTLLGRPVLKVCSCPPPSRVSWHGVLGRDGRSPGCALA